MVVSFEIELDFDTPIERMIAQIVRERISGAIDMAIAVLK